MTNHIHLLMTGEDDKAVSRAMKRIGQRYVQHGLDHYSERWVDKR